MMPWDVFDSFRLVQRELTLTIGSKLLFCEQNARRVGILFWISSGTTGIYLSLSGGYPTGKGMFYPNDSPPHEIVNVKHGALSQCELWCQVSSLFAAAYVDIIEIILDRDPCKAAKPQNGGSSSGQ